MGDWVANCGRTGFWTREAAERHERVCRGVKRCSKCGRRYCVEFDGCPRCNRNSN